jgi:hypothetical protein
MWATETTEVFDEWFTSLSEELQVEIAAKIELLQVLGPQLRRPHADTLNGSAYANMKELRAKTAGAVIRIAFAFDPLQTGILLVGGVKSGVGQRRFYKQLIEKADETYAAHLRMLPARKKKGYGK